MPTTTTPATPDPAAAPSTLAEFLAAMAIVPYETYGHGGPDLPKLDRSIRGKLDRRINAHAKKLTARAQRSLYAFATTPTLVGYLHSIRADAIRASGEAVTGWLADLPAGARVLDVACNTGHLTLWYARQFPRLEVVGCDFVPEAIDYATHLAADLGITNARFEVADLTVGLPDGPFDAITSTQGISQVEGDRAAVLARVAASLRPGGLLVSVEALRYSSDSSGFIGEASGAGLGLAGATFAHYDDYDDPSAYPVLAFRMGADPVTVDLKGIYGVALADIHRRRRALDLEWDGEEDEDVAVTPSGTP